MKDIYGIYGKGQVGQVIVLGRVNFGENSPSQLAQYNQPHFFTIIKKTEHTYTLLDENKKQITVTHKGMFTDAGHLYDIRVWSNEHEVQYQRNIKRLEATNKELNSNLNLLKEILGGRNLNVTVVDERKAKELGIL